MVPKLSAFISLRSRLVPRWPLPWGRISDSNVSQRKKEKVSLLLTNNCREVSFRCILVMDGTMREDKSDLSVDILYEDTASEALTTAENAPALLQSRDLGGAKNPTCQPHTYNPQALEAPCQHHRLSCISPALFHPPDRMIGASWPARQIPAGSG